MEKTDGLLRWQFATYSHAHRNRRNLLVHALTVPLFTGGNLALVAAWLQPWLALVGIAAMVTAMGLQGRGHAREVAPPAPFSGPLDVISRIFAEQWVTFPRFVASGGFARAWRGE